MACLRVDHRGDRWLSKPPPPQAENLEALGWPSTCNAYASAPGLVTSVPPHTDRQDVLILQSAGRKHWKVFAPPAVEEVDPLRRGKDGDVLDAAMLGEPLLEATLEPGDVLYVPLGFPHATSTSCVNELREDSASLLFRGGSGKPQRLMGPHHPPKSTANPGTPPTTPRQSATDLNQRPPSSSPPFRNLPPEKEQPEQKTMQ